MSDLNAAFAEAHRWQPEPATESVADVTPAAIELALHLLHEIAEDALLRPSQRVAARRYLRRLGIIAEGDGGGRGPDR